MVRISVLKQFTRAMCVLACVTALGFSLAATARVALADPAMQAADEMLQDGLDALNDDERELATQLFEALIQSYPGSKESQRAERELAKLGVAPEPRHAEPKYVPHVEPFMHRADDDTALRLKFATEAGDRVFFAENSAVIGGRARAMIDAQARWLAKRSSLFITIVGRADDSAPVDASNELSLRRAEAVRDKLVAAGIPATRIMVEGRGVRDPIATCKSALCQTQNRHAETLVSTVAHQTEDGRRTPSRGAAVELGAPQGNPAATVAR